MITIEQATDDAQMDTVRKLFKNYESWLGMDLCFQGFEEELRTLPGRYAPPDGRLFIAYVDGEAAGCIAMRKIGESVCEMKRLFVLEKFRGRRIGDKLIRRLIDTARKEGYEFMRLDTLPDRMKKAAELYRSYGFYSIEPYYENPYKGVEYMELDLR